MSATRTHCIEAELTVNFRLSDMPDDERETAYPKVRIIYSYTPGSPAVMYQRNGDPGWPAEPADVALINATILDGDGLDLSKDDLLSRASDWLNEAGYDEACEQARRDLDPDPDRAYDERRDRKMEEGIWHDWPGGDLA